jgi:hypothetical protein
VKHSSKTRKKISEGVRTAKNAKKVRKRRQAEADTILSNFQKGSQGKAATKIKRFAEQKEYSRVGDGHVEEKEATILVEVPTRKLQNVDNAMNEKQSDKSQKPGR